MVFALESLCDGFGVVPVTSHRVPPAPFSAGERVKAAVGNDVEAVLALHDVAHRLSVDHFDANPKRLARCVDQRGPDVPPLSSRGAAGWAGWTTVPADRN